MPNYKGTKRIADVLEYNAVDEHIQRMAGFEQIFVQEASTAVGDAVAIAQARAVENAPQGETGQLKGSIYSKMLSSLLASMTVRGAIGSTAGLKAFANEAGRWRGTGERRRFWKGKFYLYYGAADMWKEIAALYDAANQRIVNRLTVKS